MFALGPLSGAAQTPPTAPPPNAEAAPFPAPQFPAALAPPYPDANDPTALGRWFGQTTHLPAKSILAITDNAIFAAFPQHDSGPFWTVDVRLESITPEATAKLGGRSIRLRLKVRCDDNAVRLTFLDAYPGADLTGVPIHRAPPKDWAQPKPNSYVADAVSLVCDKTFRGPFAAMAESASEPKSEAKTRINPESAAAAVDRAPSLRPRQPGIGIYAVQIGAYSTPVASGGAWKALQAALPGKTSGLWNTTKPALIGGRTLYRAIVKGFPSQGAAETFCETLRAEGRACLMVGAGAS